MDDRARRALAENARRWMSGSLAEPRFRDALRAQLARSQQPLDITALPPADDNSIWPAIFAVEDLVRLGEAEWIMDGERTQVRPLMAAEARRRQSLSPDTVPLVYPPRLTPEQVHDATALIEASPYRALVATPDGRYSIVHSSASRFSPWLVERYRTGEFGDGAMLMQRNLGGGHWLTVDRHSRAGHEDVLARRLGLGSRGVE